MLIVIYLIFKIDVCLPIKKKDAIDIVGAICLLYFPIVTILRIPKIINQIKYNHGLDKYTIVVSSTIYLLYGVCFVVVLCKILFF